MTKTGWIIKGAYLTGMHEGKTFFLRKGGYVTDGEKTWSDFAYKTKGFAERECKRLKEYYDQSYRSERQDNEINIKKGLKAKEWFIYELQSFEPYEVELID